METPASWTTWPCSWKFDSSDLFNFWNELSENWQTHNCHKLGSHPAPLRSSKYHRFPPRLIRSIVHPPTSGKSTVLEHIWSLCKYLCIYIYAIGTCTGSNFSPLSWTKSHTLPVLIAWTPMRLTFSLVNPHILFSSWSPYFTHFQWLHPHALPTSVKSNSHILNGISKTPRVHPTKSFRLVDLTPPDRSGLAHKARRRSLLDCWPKESGV